MEVSQPLDHVTHAVIGGGKTIDFGISNSAEFFDILSRTLYTDQILAVVREVLCNAWDAHIAAGCTDKPIQIKLDEEFFEVRDFGPGIHHNEIGPIYGVYGASTKKNDGTQTGGFGLGCKAPFAYTDHFEVISHHNGTKTIYNMSKSNAVAAGKPGIIPLAALPTTESGLRVKMPIQRKDNCRFKTLIERIVANGEMNAELDGKKLYTIPFSTFKDGYLITNRQVVEDERGKTLFVRYGNVIYPFASCEGIADLYRNTHGYLSNLSIMGAKKLILQAPPNSISVTPSRESLSMQDHTISTLRKLLERFLEKVQDVDEVMLSESQRLIDETIAKKDIRTLLSDSWGFRQQRPMEGDGHLYISNIQELAQHRLRTQYPKSITFRAQDLKNRLGKAAEAKILNPVMTKSYIEQLSTVSSPLSLYMSPLKKAASSDWLQRHIFGKVITKLINNEMSPEGLCIMDQYDPNAGYGNRDVLTHYRKSVSRNHLANLPYLQKVVVITTAITTVRARFTEFAVRNGNKYPNSGVLCYHIRSRKPEAVDKALVLFKKLGYEVIDLTKRQSWEEPAKSPTPRAKPQPFSGLPALSNMLLPSGSLHVSNYAAISATILPSPELVMVVTAREENTNQLDNISIPASKALIALYGNRIGIASNKTKLNKALKHGAVEYLPVLEQDMLNTLTNSKSFREFCAYDFERVSADVTHECATSILKIIYNDVDLRAAFGLKNNLTPTEKRYLRLIRDARIISKSCETTISQFMSSVPLAAENKFAVQATTSNELLSLISDSVLRSGLKSPKRQVYLDILLKALKG